MAPPPSLCQHSTHPAYSGELPATSIPPHAWGPLPSFPQEGQETALKLALIALNLYTDLPL